MINCRQGSGLFASGQHIRLIGVGGSNLDHGEFRQLSLEDALAGMMMVKKPSAGPEISSAGQELPSAEEKTASENEKRQKRLREMQADILERFGPGAIRKGAEPGSG